jgi:hypothetical protein
LATGVVISPDTGAPFEMPAFPASLLGYNEEKKTLNEPLIETTWKILMNAHSYCYPRFSEYFNDHHTFTVAMMPLFSNNIQSIWYTFTQLTSFS